MAKELLEFEKLGLEMRVNPDQPFVFEVFDKAGKRLSREEFYKQYSDSLLPQTSLEMEASAQRSKLLGEGDSWINILWPISSILGHEKTFFDVIERSGAFNTLDQGWPGDTLENMLAEKQYEQPIKSGLYSHFIFSAAGNDVLGGGALSAFIKPINETDSTEPVETWFHQATLKNAYARIEAGYDQVAKEIKVWSAGKTDMYIHGYDYVVPRENGPWLGTPLENAGYNLVTDATRISAIITYLVDGLYETLSRVAKRHSHVNLIDVRGIVQGRWNDELHAKGEASEDIAALFMNEIAVIV